MKPGDKLYFVHKYHRKHTSVTVKSVGRRWVRFETLGQWKMDRDTRAVFDATDWPVGQCYESQQAYENSQLLGKELLNLKRFVARMTDAETTREAVRKAAEVLGMEFDQ